MRMNCQELIKCKSGHVRACRNLSTHVVREKATGRNIEVLCSTHAAKLSWDDRYYEVVPELEKLVEHVKNIHF